MNAKPDIISLIPSTMLATLLVIAIPAWTIWGLWSEGVWAILLFIVAQWLLLSIPLGIVLFVYDALHAIGKGLCRMGPHEDARSRT